MGLRFRKSISIGKGVRLNISKRGVGNNLRSSIPTQSLTGTHWVWGIIIGFVLIFNNPIVGLPLLGASFYFFRKKMHKPQNKSKTEYNKGVSEFKKNNLDRANSFLDRALEYDQSNHMARLLLTNIAFSQGKYDKVLANLEKLPDAVYDDPSTSFAAAISNFSLESYDKAIPLLQELSNIEGYQDEASIFLGRCFLEKGMYTLAVESFKKGPVLKRTINPVVMEAKYWLGVTYTILGDSKKASTQLSTVYAEDVNFRDVARYVEELDV